MKSKNFSIFRGGGDFLKQTTKSKAQLRRKTNNNNNNVPRPL